MGDVEEGREVEVEEGAEVEVGSQCGKSRQLGVEMGRGSRKRETETELREEMGKEKG
jgi:hypothetical protein